MRNIRTLYMYIKRCTYIAIANVSRIMKISYLEYTQIVQYVVTL